MSTIVKIPKNKVDYDYIAFSFCGKHSIEDFGIYRVSEANDGYTHNLTLESKDITAEVEGADGTFYFGSTAPKQTISIKIAFDNLSEDELQAAKVWLNTKDLGDLWFAEAPHRVYRAKITSAATITTVAFEDSEKGRVYKGTGTLQFTAYYPYARTPDWVQQPDGELLDGNSWESYLNFYNYKEIQYALPRAQRNEVDCASAYGDLPFHFVAQLVSPNSESEVVITHEAHGTKYNIKDATYSTSNGKTTINYKGKGGST